MPQKRVQFLSLVDVEDELEELVVEGDLVGEPPLDLTKKRVQALKKVLGHFIQISSKTRCFINDNTV